MLPYFRVNHYDNDNLSRAIMHTYSPTHFSITDLGKLPYRLGLQIQRNYHQRVLDDVAPQCLFYVEHEPVITVSRRKNAQTHLLAQRHELKRLGIEVEPTDRGGDVTYHGPGQLVAYPIMRLAPLKLNVGRYMRLLEKTVIDTLSTFGINTFTDPINTGVWTHDPEHEKPSKICAMGVRLKRNITMHGLALNIRTDMDHFRTIVPCGIPDRQVTSMHRILGQATPQMLQVKQVMSTHFKRRLQACLPESDRHQIQTAKLNPLPYPHNLSANPDTPQT